ncbi:hypothetical protein SAMN06265171_10841 [Chryseobacterium rhizoplanae]|uniref:Uncharacterized protein n=1 Tax=Chryseobacterium rhizoplanae TaxID=1609531 RepID=A0A521EGM0_9FLAO|nr:hypothetical protein [Chryseobacterium rhizoplanae]SMO83077.1 hypothetical protein SAMN06265171_10841 [Chryseobacterium rhizoplanae]
MKNLFLVIIILIIISCKGEEKKEFLKIQSKVNISQIQNENLDFTSIDNSSIGQEITDSMRKKIIQFYKQALERDFERPYIWDALLPDNENFIKIYNYKKYIINNMSFNSYCIKIKYEDANYESILLTVSNLEVNTRDNSSIIVYENQFSEELYKRYSKINNGNVLNIILQKDKKDYNHFQYLVAENMFLDYFTTDNKQINRNWGENEDNIYDYQIKGTIKNHLKNGHWEEKRYSFDYNKSVWMDGEYSDGVRNKEWNISPDGPVEKIKLYNNGFIVRIFSP